MTIPIKRRVEGLGEFEPNDAVSIEHGGTGSTSLTDAQNVLGISDKLDRSEYVQHFKGVFASYSALMAAFPTATDGDYAHIDSGTDFDRLAAIWDSSDNKWIISQVSTGVNTDEVPEGSQNLYFKSQRVLNTLLTGLVAGSTTEIAATDNVITALQKLQAQIKNNWNWVSITQIGAMFDTASNYQFAQEHFINGVGGVWFCIKDNTLYMKALFKVIGNVNGTGQRLFTITNLAYKPKFGASNLFVVRSSAGSPDDLSGAGLNQLIFSYRNATTYMYFSSQQSLSNGGVYMIPVTAIGFISNP